MTDKELVVGEQVVLSGTLIKRTFHGRTMLFDILVDDEMVYAVFDQRKIPWVFERAEYNVNQGMELLIRGIVAERVERGLRLGPPMTNVYELQVEDFHLPCIPSM